MSLTIFKFNKFLNYGLKSHQNTTNLLLTSNLNRYYSSTSEETSNEDAEKPAEGIVSNILFILTKIHKIVFISKY
jgi:hypothetical protein